MAHDPKASAAVAAGWLEANPVVGPVLTVDDAGPIREHLEAAGVPSSPWNRYATAGAAATAWPPDGPFATAVVHLPKGRDAQRMVLHAVAARLMPDGLCLVHGHNDEGIKSAKRPCTEVFASAEPVDARRHCRVWACRGSLGAGLGSIDDWATQVNAKLGKTPFSWTSWPGLFAHGRLDIGTKLLLKTLPPFGPHTEILDWACGSGVVARALLAREPTLRMDLLDLDALALYAARRNVPEAGTAWLTDGWIGVPRDRHWDAIVTNPPWHSGVATDWTALKDLIRQAPDRLKPKGSLWMVTQRTVRVEFELKQGFRHVHAAASSPGFIVWQAKKT